jgi:V/A-type H+-transporting ATPase subunit I
MKESMKKLTVLSFYKDVERTTIQLQKLGIIHPEIHAASTNNDLELLEIKRNQFKKAINFLTSFNSTSDLEKDYSDFTPELEEIVSKVEYIRMEKDGLRKKREALDKQLQQMIPWGDFDKEKVGLLEEKGLQFRFYVAKKRNFRKFDFKTIIHFPIHQDSDRIFFVVIKEADEKIKLPFERIKLPDLQPSEISIQHDLINDEEKTLDKKLKLYSTYLSILKIESAYLKDQIERIKVSSSFDSSLDGKIMSIVGWYPAKIEEYLTIKLKKKKITFLTSKPSNTDHVPVRLKNNRYAKLFEPVTGIFQLPNYREFDLTPLIAVFYPIFFAYCLGDAGYGFIVVVLSLVGGFTILKNNKNMVIFGVLLGFFTMIMGIIKSGSIFGIPVTPSSEIPLFQYLAQFLIIPDDRDFVFNAFNVALMIGVVQILVGVISATLKSAVYQSWNHSLPYIGKFLIISSVIVIFLANMQGVTALLPYLPAANIILYIGIALVLVFHDFDKSILKRVSKGILPLFFIFTGILGDVLSYVRLFALGVVSSVLGLVVNQIGMQIMENGWWGVILGIAFLIFGHSLNLSLAILGAFVHPLRLTFVEFYNNAQFEGGGIPYKPFQKNLNT